MNINLDFDSGRYWCALENESCGATPIYLAFNIGYNPVLTPVCIRTDMSLLF